LSRKNKLNEVYKQVIFVGADAINAEYCTINIS
jgi:hypothetical protein